jgi:hypothetical protein
MSENDWPSLGEEQEWCVSGHCRQAGLCAARKQASDAAAVARAAALLSGWSSPLDDSHGLLTSINYLVLCAGVCELPFSDPRRTVAARLLHEGWTVADQLCPDAEQAAALAVLLDTMTALLL